MTDRILVVFEARDYNRATEHQTNCESSAEFASQNLAQYRASGSAGIAAKQVADLKAKNQTPDDTKMVDRVMQEGLDCLLERLKADHQMPIAWR